jgi:hypothetical protein
MLKARFGPGTESSGELNSTANGGTQIPACKATEALNWTARRATQADIASSTLSLEERREAGERDPKPPANDGVWIGQTPAGVVVRFLLLDNTLAWLRTDLSLPDQCELGPKDSRYRTRVRFAELTGGELKDGAFRAAGSPTESLLKVTGAVSGRLSGGQFDGRFEYAAKGDSAFLKNCDYKIASEWTAHKAAPEEAKPLLSVHERIALGENVPMIRKVEFGSVAGNECGKQPFVPAAKPYQYPSPAVHIAYRIEMNPEAAPLVNEVGTEIEPALGSETYRNYCTDMIIDGGRSVPGVITTILRRSDSAPLRPGVYKFKVKVNGETTAAYTESFTVK